MKLQTVMVRKMSQFGVLMKDILTGMTSLEMWTLACVVTVFGTLLTYAIILSRDQMIIQGVLNAEGEAEEEEDEDGNTRKIMKPRSAWSDSNIYVSKVIFTV